MKPLRLALFTVLAGLSSAVVAQQGGGAAAPAKPPRDIRFVVIHSPGPRWDAAKSMFEQDGVQAHVDHYRQLLRLGKLMAGGPFLDDRGGGMMIPAPGVPEQEIRQFAQDDPAVRSGLLRAEVRPWLIGLQQAAGPGS